MAADLGCTAPISGDLTSGHSKASFCSTPRSRGARARGKLPCQADGRFSPTQLCGFAQLEQPVVFLTWGRHAIDMAEAAREATDATANKFFLPLRTPRRSLPRAPRATFPPSWVRAPSRAPMSCLPNTVPPPSIGAPNQRVATPPHKKRDGHAPIASKSTVNPACALRLQASG